MDERHQKCRPEVLYHHGRVVPRQIDGRFQSYVVQDERADDAVDDCDAELVQILRAEALRDSEEPLDVLAVGRIAGVLGLGPVVVDPPGQGLEGEHADAIGRDEGVELLLAERLALTVDLLLGGVTRLRHRREEELFLSRAFWAAYCTCLLFHW